MLTRRSVRVKVFHVLYEHLFVQENTTFDTHQQVKILIQKWQTQQKELQLALYCLIDIITRVLLFAKQESVFEDRKILIENKNNIILNSLILQSSVLQNLLKELDTFKKHNTKVKYIIMDDEDVIRQLFKMLAQSDVYIKYVQANTLNEETEKKIIYHLVQAVFPQSNVLVSFIEDNFLSPEEDINDIITHIQVHQLNNLFSTLLDQEKTQFGQELLETYIVKYDIIKETIQQYATGWEFQRINKIDKVLLSLGIVEFLYFETIPFKATLSEYIEIAKEYGNETSYIFINGILDKIKQNIEKENKIHKVS